jgi:hypothetical protein
VDQVCGPLPPHCAPGWAHIPVPKTHRAGIAEPTGGLQSAECDEITAQALEELGWQVLGSYMQTALSVKGPQSSRSGTLQGALPLTSQDTSCAARVAGRLAILLTVASTPQ